MTRTTVTAMAVAVGALVGVFVVVAVTVVDARRPLDGRVSRSFDAVIAKQSVRNGTLESLGCRKERLYVYACAAHQLFRRRPPSTIYWMLWLQDDGCWKATRGEALLPSASTLALRLPILSACTG
jgi:DNA-binding transcriptional LysR family regulator